MNNSIRSIGLVGVGLIGGSLALSLRRVLPSLQVMGYGRSQDNLNWALEHGVITHKARSLADLGDCDLVVLATPLSAMENALDTLVPHLSPHTLLTDVGSAKACVVDTLQRLAAKHPEADLMDRFVPGHPIAGRENSGAQAAEAALYDGARVILTPISENTEAAVNTLTRLWELAGASVQLMDAQHHDEVLAATSHLPHVLAYQLVNTLAEMEEQREIFAYAAGGFRDFTRIAASDPVMWRDICVQNRQAILAVFDQYLLDLTQLRNQLADGQASEALLQSFQHAQRAKQQAEQAKV